jgi:hypothetical protein
MLANHLKSAGTRSELPAVRIKVLSADPLRRPRRRECYFTGKYVRGVVLYRGSRIRDDMEWNACSNWTQNRETTPRQPTCLNHVLRASSEAFIGQALPADCHSCLRTAPPATVANAPNSTQQHGSLQPLICLLHARIRHHVSIVWHRRLSHLRMLLPAWRLQVV